MPCVSLRHRRIYSDLIKQSSLNFVKPINPPETQNNSSLTTKNHNKSKQNQFTTLLTDGMVVRIHQSRYLVASAPKPTILAGAQSPQNQSPEKSSNKAVAQTISEPTQPKAKKSKTKGKFSLKSKVKLGKQSATKAEDSNLLTSAGLPRPKRLKKLRRLTRADLINAESRLGSTIFGPVPEGHRREFFHDHDNIWIWHESWTDSKHRLRQTTIRYEARPDGVYKKVSAGRYIRLTSAELTNFRQATRTYLRLIKQHLYPKRS